jgi:UDP-glucose 4-epimerase
VYNIGTSTEIPIIELARRVIEHTESDSQIDFVPYEDAYEDGFEELGRRKPDTTAIRELTGWRPELTVDDAIKDVVAFERQRQGGSPLAA